MYAQSGLRGAVGLGEQVVRERQQARRLAVRLTVGRGLGGGRRRGHQPTQGNGQAERDQGRFQSCGAICEHPSPRAEHPWLMAPAAVSRALLCLVLLMPQPMAQPSDAAISKRLVLLLALTCGAAAANMYYAQPLLHTIGATFSVSEGTAGLLVTASQVGYATRPCVSRPAGRSARAPGTDRGDADRVRPRPGRGCARAGVRLVRARARRRRADLGGRPDRRADVILAGRPARARRGRRNRDERLADRSPDRAHCERHHRRAARLEIGVRDRRGADVRAGGGAALRPAVRCANRGPALPLAAALGAGPGARGAAAAPANGARRRRDGLLQRAVDVDRVPALRRAVSLQQHRDRPVRPRRARRRVDRASHGAPGRPRSRQAGHLGHDRGAAGQLGPAGPRRPLDPGTDRRHRRARSRRPGAADLKPERDLLAATRGPQPADDRIHGRLLRRRRLAVGGGRGAVQHRRLGRSVRAGRDYRDGRAGRVARNRAALAGRARGWAPSPSVARALRG